MMSGAFSALSAVLSRVLIDAFEKNVFLVQSISTLLASLLIYPVLFKRDWLAFVDRLAVTGTTDTDS